MEINRFRFTDKAVAKAIQVLKGDIAKSKAPTFLKRFKEIQLRNGKLFYQEKEIIKTSDIAKKVRDLLYTKGSTTPWSRDAGYAALSKKYIGISRRAFRDVTSAQKIKVESDNVPPAIKKKGRKLSKKGQIEIDLFHISRNDLPKELQGKITDISVPNTQSYVLSMIDKLTGLYYGHYVGKSKSRTKVMKAVRDGGKWFAERLGVPVEKQIYLRDRGKEFAPQSELKGRLMKLGPAVEGVNSHVQRIMHRLIAAKRGGLQSVVKQAMAIKNNTKSTISGATPDEASKKDGKDLAPAYNKKRATGEPDKYQKLGIGHLVRIVTKKPKGTFYKAYQKTQYSKKLYPIKRVSKNKPWTYFVGGLWKSRDQISGPQKPIDQEAEKLLASRTQYGNKKTVVTMAEKKEKLISKKRAKVEEQRLYKLAPRRGTRARKQTGEERKKKELEEVRQSIEFKKLLVRFKALVAWVNGEESKNYSGPNESKLEKIYNDKINEGKELTKKMSKLRKRWKNKKYFTEFKI